MKSALGLALALWFAVWSVPAFGQSYQEGLKAFEAGEFDRAFEIWRPLADRGDPVAQYSLGKLFERGGGAIEQDFAKAARWYRVAASQGIAAAQNNLALMHAQGRGVDRNVKQAIDLWLSAADRNHPMAQYNLGLAFFRGEGVQKDEREAAGWFRRAADAGLSDAQYAMGQMNRLGRILSKDEAKALAWYERAASQGHREAKKQSQLLQAAGIESQDPGPPQVAPTAVASRQAPAEPEAEAVAQVAPAAGAAPEPSAEPQSTVIVPETAAPASPSAAQTGQTVAQTTAQSAPATTQISEATSRSQTTDAQINGDVTATATTAAAGDDGRGGGVPLPRRKPAVPQLAMQTMAPLNNGAEQSAMAAPAADDADDASDAAYSIATPSASPSASGVEATASEYSVQAGAAAAGTAPAATQQAARTPSGAGGIQVWLASERDPDDAMKLWAGTQARFADVLGDAQPAVTEVSVGEGGTFFRLMAGPLASPEAARDLCALMRLKDEDAFCKVLQN